MGLGAPSERISLVLRNPECCDGKIMVGKDQWFDMQPMTPINPPDFSIQVISHRRRKQGGEGGGRPPRFLVQLEVWKAGL